MVAYVVEASVQDGRPVLRRVTAGVHCNLAVNPRSVEAQVQGAAVMGEPGLPPLATAFANAVARLTGKPLRQLPFNLA